MAAQGRPWSLSPTPSLPPSPTPSHQRLRPPPSYEPTAAESTAEPTAESAAEPTAEPTAESAAGSTAESAAESESTAESATGCRGSAAADGAALLPLRAAPPDARQATPQGGGAEAADRGGAERGSTDRGSSDRAGSVGAASVVPRRRWREKGEGSCVPLGSGAQRGSAPGGGRRGSDSGSGSGSGSVSVSGSGSG